MTSRRVGAEGRAIAAIDRALTSIEHDKAALRRVGQWMTAKFGEQLLAKSQGGAGGTGWYRQTDGGGYIAIEHEELDSK